MNQEIHNSIKKIIYQKWSDIVRLRDNDNYLSGFDIQVPTCPPYIAKNYLGREYVKRDWYSRYVPGMEGASVYQVIRFIDYELNKLREIHGALKLKYGYEQFKYPEPLIPEWIKRDQILTRQPEGQRNYIPN